MTKIQTRTLEFVDFLNPDPDTIRLEDIAHALALTNRYGGHTPLPYSVAQHSVLCSLVAPPELAREALLHDAQEAYLGDVPTTLKRLLPDFREVEERFEKVIRAKFRLPPEMTPAVKEIDTRMLVTEARQLGFRGWWEDIDAEPYPKVVIHGQHWKDARQDFIHRFNQLAD